jgi:thiosulfate dehydrogenase [quinone] large subunit
MSTTTTHSSEMSVVHDDKITTPAGQKWAGVVRILLGFTFLWAFLDKNFAWGFSTTKAWMFGTGDGNPTAGFLKFGVNPNGPFQSFYTNLAPSSPNGIVNWLFMGALLGAGLTLVLGVAMRIGCIGSALLLISMFLAVAPWAKYEDKGGSTVASNNPLLDEHIIYAATLMVLMLICAGRYWGLGRWWESKTPTWLH